jgi:hypothetical protein
MTVRAGFAILCVAKTLPSTMSRRACAAVFFDLDGTLLDTTYLHTVA